MLVLAYATTRLRMSRRVEVRWVSLAPAPAPELAPRAPADRLPPLEDGEVSLVYRHAGQEKLFTYVPVAVEGPVEGALELSEPRASRADQINAEVLGVLQRTGLAALATIAAVVLLGVHLVGRPMKRLVEKARRIGDGDLTGPALVLRQRDEIGELAAEMNQMCDRLREAQEKLEAETARRLTTAEQLRHADRLTTVGKLASGLAHELGTPLNVVSGRAKMIARGQVTGAEAEDNARIMMEQCDRMALIIRQLLGFARRREPHRAATDLRALAAQTLQLLAPIAQKARVELRMAAEAREVTTAVDGTLLQQALTNLVVNGIQAMPEGGTLEVSSGIARRRPPADPGGPYGEFACIHVRDEGIGIQAANLPHVFEPFFTTKEVGEGTGLGLSLAYGIVRDHGGWIDVESAPGQGSRFTIFLPLAPGGSERA
jgi:signal transduction histidine kinase